MAFHAHVHFPPWKYAWVHIQDRCWEVMLSVCVNTEAGRAAYHILYDRCNTLLIILMCPMNTDNEDAAAPNKASYPEV